MPKRYRGVIRADMKFVLAGRNLSCYFAYRNASEADPTGFECSQIAQTVATEWAVNIGVGLSNELRFVGCDARGMESDLSAQASFALPPNSFGAFNSPAMPPNVAFVVQRSTGLTGRRGRGRIYIPGLAEGSVANATIGAGDAQAFADKLQLMDNAVSALTGYDAVTLGNEPINGGLGTIFFESYLVEQWRYTDTIVDTRRKRL